MKADLGFSDVISQFVYEPVVDIVVYLLVDPELSLSRPTEL